MGVLYALGPDISLKLVGQHPSHLLAVAPAAIGQVQTSTLACAPPSKIDHQECTPLAYMEHANSGTQDQDQQRIRKRRRTPVLLFVQRPIYHESRITLNGSNRLPRSHALKSSPHIVRPSRHVFCRPDAVQNRPCGGQDMNQALDGHLKPPVGNHRTLQVFSPQPPSWGVATWGDDDHVQHGDWVSPNGPVGKTSCLPFDDHPDNDRSGGDHHEHIDRHDARDSSCRDRLATKV